jgi:hypothetical protein
VPSVAPNWSAPPPTSWPCRLHRLAATADQAEALLGAEAKAALVAGPELTVADYNNNARTELAAGGQDIPPIGRMIAFFGTSREAKEALGLRSAPTGAPRSSCGFGGASWTRSGTTARRRRRRRSLGPAATTAAHRWVAEYAAWRDAELGLARAKGDDAAHLPSATPYRRSYGSWEEALLYFGYDAGRRGAVGAAELSRGGPIDGDSSGLRSPWRYALTPYARARGRLRGPRPRGDAPARA